MKSVAIYIRVSTKEQLQGGSLATQLRACMDYSERHGYEVASVFQEEGESAKTATDRSFNACSPTASSAKARWRASSSTP